jgi:DNA repair exonuclease SbcCD ATPase subunit
MLKNLNLLEFAEYFFLAATVGSTIATLLGESVYYSLVPVSIALVLGAINRFRLEKQSQASKNALQAKIDSDRETATQLISQLETRIGSLKLSATNEEGSHENASLAARDEANINNLITAIKSLSNRLNIQEQTIKMLQTELELVSQQFRRRPELEQINNLTSIIVDLQQFINELPQWGSLQQKQLIEIQEKVNNALTQLSEELADIPHKVDAAVQTLVDEINQNP